MLPLPSSPKLAGSLKLDSDNDNWRQLFDADAPFGPTSDPFVQLTFDGSAKFQGDSSLTVDLGAGFSSSGSCSLQLFWPDQPRDPGNVIDRFGVGGLLAERLPDGGQHLYVAVVLQGKAQASLTGKVPHGALSATFGVEAGGDLLFTQLVRFSARDRARSILKTLFTDGTLRLPQSVVAARTPPATGEVIALAYGGYLSLSSKITWGYSLAKSQSFAVGDFASSIDYNLKLAASVALGYKLAGNFSLEVRADDRPDWARLVVRRHRDETFSFTADLALQANYEVPDLADQSFEDVLRATVGVDAASLTQKLNRALALTDPAALRAHLGNLAYAWCAELAQPLYGAVFDQANVQTLVARLGATARKISTLDQQVAALLQEHLGGKFDALPAKLDELLAVDDLAQHLGVADTDTWRLLDRLFGDKLQKYLHEGAPSAAIKQKLGELKGLLVEGPSSEIAKWLKTTQEKLGVAKLLEQLATLTSADDLKKLTDAKLQALVGDLVGQAFDQIAAQQAFSQAFAELKKARDAVAKFRAAWKETLGKISAQKFSAELVYRYSQADSEDRLLDLSINLKHAHAPEFFERALRGDFVPLMSANDATLVTFHAGSIERESVAASELRLHVFGYETSSLRTLTQDASLTLQAGNNGLLAIYASTTLVDEKRKQTGRSWEESQWSTLSLRAAGEAAQGRTDTTLLRTLSALDLNYTLRFDDSATSFDELAEYLRFCSVLRLGPPDYIARLQKLLGPRTPGKVQISYDVSYAPGSLAAVFQLPAAQILEIAQRVRREFYRSYYLASEKFKTFGWIGLAYADQAFHDAYAQFSGGSQDDVFRWTNVTVPAAWNHGTPGKRSFPTHLTGAVITHIRAEAFFLPPLAAFDQLFDLFAARLPVPVEEFERRARDLIAAKRYADTYAERNYSPFFVILDALIAEATRGRAVRKSSVRIALTPPGAETINQFLSA